MNRRIQISAIMCASAIVTASFGSPFVSEAYAETCVGAGPQICVDFLDAGNPLVGFDFTVGFTDPQNPDVTLIKGSLFWQVRSRVGPPPNDTPANIGDITLNPTVSTEDFGVKIANGAGPGAANVGTINLDDVGFTGFSSIAAGSHISGSLTGPLTVVRDSGGAGGEVSLTIDSDASGAMTIPVLKNLVIGGDLSADLTVSQKIDCGGQLNVGGAVHALASISITNICANSNASLVFDSDDSGDNFAGDLFLGNGVTNNSTVTFNGPISTGATIDLNSGGVRGTLACLNQSNAMIINGGAVVIGFVTLAAGNGNAFSGTAEFERLSVGFIWTEDGADLDGQVSVTGDMVLFPSEIRIKGDLTSNGSISVAGTTNQGFIVVQGSVTGGDINLADMRGSQLEVWGSVTSPASLIQIGNMANGGPGTPSVVSILGDFAGTLELGTGIKLGQTVRILGEFLAGATIDLTNDPVAGDIYVSAGSGDILNGGALSGTATLGAGGLLSFSGTAVFASVSSAGTVQTEFGADFDGRLTITGAMAGQIDFSDDFGSSAGADGLISIVGTAGGDITIRGDVVDSADIVLSTGLAGSTLTVEGDVPVGSSTIFIYDMISAGGNHSLVDFQQVFGGALDLRFGIKANQEVRIGGEVTSINSIGLNDRSLAGTLKIVGGGNGQIYDVGAVSGTVILADGVANTYSGSADFASVSGRGVIKTVNGAHFSGTLQLASGSSGDIHIDGDCSGDLSIGATIKGDVHIAGELTATGIVNTTGMLGGRGRIMVDGQCKGRIKVGQRTDPLTLIDLSGGLYVGGKVEINTSEGKYNAEGVINVGSAAACSLSPPDVTFDGCIRIYNDSASGNYGNLEGAISISGCHNPGDLNICVDGSDNGNVNICQNGCTNHVGWSCGTCPPA